MNKYVLNLETSEIHIRELTRNELEAELIKDTVWEDGAARREEVRKGEIAKNRLLDAILAGESVDPQDREDYRKGRPIREPE